MVDNSIISREQKGYFIASPSSTGKQHRRSLESAKERNTKDAPGTAFTPKLQFPTTYHVIGVLKLPYGEISEPFEAWYSKNEKMSRIDYYGGKLI